MMLLTLPNETSYRLGARKLSVSTFLPIRVLAVYQ